MYRSLVRVGLCMCLMLLASASHAALNAEESTWNQPVKPFRMIGNIYYVGASDVTSYLIVTPKGLILLDGGFAETAPQVESNIQALGYKLRDVKVLLNSHAHDDHAGGLAELKRATHASFAASAADAALIAKGGKDDFSFGDRHLYPPVQADRILKDGDTVELGGTTLTAHLTPGHTKGCTTWTMWVTEAGAPHNVVFLCSVSILDYPLVNNPKYPGIADDFTHTFATLKSLPCDVFLGAHGRYYDLKGKIARLQKHEPGNPFIDPQGYKDFVAAGETTFKQALEAQRKAASTADTP